MKGYGDNFKQRVIDSFKKEPEIQAQFTDIQIIVPKITFAHRLDIVRGGRDLRIIRIGGHTAATSVIWMPDDKILFVGDAVWVDQHPYMAQANSKEWLDGLTYIRKLKADQIVPGRGPVCGREATERMSEYIRFMRARVRCSTGSRDQTGDHAGRAPRGRWLVPDHCRGRSPRPSRRSSKGSAASGTSWKRPRRLKEKIEPEIEPEEAGDE